MKNWDAFIRLTIRDGAAMQSREDKGKSHRNQGIRRDARRTSEREALLPQEARVSGNIAASGHQDTEGR
ncbi:hypothetical protein ACPWML_27335, partial [Pandoraea pneumonica]|uniref:hypothetical protein n=1 Tax=Pandoraea pneumonica TaxID=2508299 RepID=UPI003CF1987F